MRIGVMLLLTCIFFLSLTACTAKNSQYRSARLRTDEKNDR